MFFAFFGKKSELPKFISEMDQATLDWTMRAARKECGWICSDCCLTFQDGMPDVCPHNHTACSDTITRDKILACQEQIT